VPNLSIDTRSDGAVHVVEIVGDLDLAATGLLEGALADAEAARPDVLVLDLRGVEFMDSSGLRSVIVAAQRAEKDARRFALVPGQKQVMRVFEITRMEERLEFVDDPASLARQR
jgi:anti-sigma B factor antagonist